MAAHLLRRMVIGCVAACQALLSQPSYGLANQATRGGSLRLKIETSAGPIGIALAMDAAPITSCNFLRYALGGHYDGGRFFRTVRGKQGSSNSVPIDVIQVEAQAGEETDLFGPIVLERTSATGLRHTAGALSMARFGPDTATSSFSIVARQSDGMDFGGRRNPDGQGFAVFGHVVSGMSIVMRIHRSEAVDEKLVSPVSILRIRAEHPSRAAREFKRRCR